MGFPVIVAVKAIDKYKLNVQFDDGIEGTYDVSHLAGKGIFKSWDIDDNFFKVGIHEESGAISWPGELDLDSLNIYCIIKGVTPENIFHNSVTHASYK